VYELSSPVTQALHPETSCFFFFFFSCNCFNICRIIASNGTMINCCIKIVRTEGETLVARYFNSVVFNKHYNTAI
jgi:hypothetical protein